MYSDPEDRWEAPAPLAVARTVLVAREALVRAVGCREVVPHVARAGSAVARAAGAVRAPGSPAVPPAEDRSGRVDSAHPVAGAAGVAAPVRWR